ncbi:MAG: retroviral-like aspartic protease family protein [Marinifilaceae bacterium]|jgi:hypothetical protein|nr:retroviral-like aspartic protease family protein [Marinifilaceae bacterium]
MIHIFKKIHTKYKRRYSIPIELVELEYNSYHIVVKVEMDDKIKGYFIIDTGASKTVVDNDFVKELDCESLIDSEIQSRGIGEGEIETNMVTIRKMKFSDFVLYDYNCASIDFTGINQMYSKYSDKKISGLLGSDILFNYNAIIDYNKMHILIDIE